VFPRLLAIPSRARLSLDLVGHVPADDSITKSFEERTVEDRVM
jgi:hypothetical protein